MQLNKYLALCGVASRRKANDCIAAGRVSVNGRTVDRLGVQVKVGEDAVKIDGKILHPARHFRYVLLNKPADAVTTVRDDQGRKTVLDLIGEPHGLFPVGRLDLDTEGVLLLTNDGELAHRLAHPRYEIDKLYRAWVPGQFGEDAVKRFRKGVVIEGGFVARGEARAVRRVGAKTLVEVRIHEGKKRQVRRMFQSLGFTVRRLSRVNFGGLTVRGLALGEWRDLKPEEIRMLYRAVGLTAAEKSSKFKAQSSKAPSGSEFRVSGSESKKEIRVTGKPSLPKPEPATEPFRFQGSGSKKGLRIRKPFNPKRLKRGSGFRVPSSESKKNIRISEKAINPEPGTRNSK
ncbi:MAG: pseudouridine synthase [bacterium]|nr:pseudouridine synthase [bacterium]